MKYYLNSLQWSRFFLLYFPWMVCIQSFLFSYSSSIAKTENSLKPMVGKPTTISGGAATHLISSRRRRILPLSLHTPPHRDQNQPPLTPQHHDDHQNPPKTELFSATTKERGGERGGGELFPTNILEEEDPEIYALIHKEWNRQLNGLELIASENFVSSAVLNALGSCLTNKYSEGQPNNRYYGGNQFIDSIEILCQQRALRLFSLSSDAWSVNVQPYSGSPANFAVYTALLKPHDRIMGLDLPSGGHLTHGYQTLKRKVSATSIFFESLPYRVNPTTGLIDYEEMQKLAELFKPKLLIAGASAYPRDWDYERMRKIADSVGAYLMADIAHISGLVATNEAKNPFEYCDVVTTTTHKSLRGPRAGMIFCKKNLTDAINLAVFPALQGGPHNHQIAAIAVALKEASTTEFHHYIQQVKRNAVALATGLQSYGYKIVTNGTENHLVLWDVRSTGLNGAKLEKLFELCDISVNKNSIAGDQSAINPGGIRLGTPAMTTRGMKEEEMKYIATLLHRIVLIGKKINHHLSTSTTTTSNANGIGNGGNVVKLKDFIEFIHHNEAIKIEIELMKREVMQFAQSYHLPGSSVKDATSPIR